MKDNRAAYKNIFYNMWLYLIVLLFFVPFFGNFGRAVFMRMGKFYYAALFVFCAINFICRGLFWQSSFNDIFYTSRRSGNSFLLKVLITVYILVACVIINRAIVDLIYLIILIGFLMFFASYKFTCQNLSVISYLTSVLNVLLLVASLVKKFDYFNPNTYAEIATVLFLFSCFNYKSTLKRQIVFLFNFAIALITSEFIYKAETQLLSLLFFVALFVMRKYLFKNTKRTKFMILAVWLFVTCLPFVVYKLIDMNVLTEAVFTTRGERWVLSIDAFKANGIFASNMNVPGSHNGFLDVCVKYTLVGAVLLAILMIKTYFSYSPYIVNNDLKTVTFCAILSIVFMNSVESIFVGLTDGYFLMILTGILISLCITEKQKKGELQLNRGKVYCEKCYI